MIINSILTVFLLLVGLVMTILMSAEISAARFLENTHGAGSYPTTQNWVVIVVSWVLVGLTVWRVWV